MGGGQLRLRLMMWCSTPLLTPTEHSRLAHDSAEELRTEWLAQDSMLLLRREDLWPLLLLCMLWLRSQLLLREDEEAVR